MHVKGFLHKMLSSVMHKKRLETLYLLVSAVLQNKKLSLTELGRSIDLPIQERSGIRRADRFLGNKKLLGECFGIEKIIAANLIQHKKPQIIVDWSDIPNSFNCVLRASLVAKGRSITLHEEVHSEKKYSNPKIEKMFLRKLKSILPEGSEPIIITDAGFRNTWFREIMRLGWNFVGRVRGTKKYSYDGKKWYFHSHLFAIATSVPKNIGAILLGRKKPLECNLYLFKNKPKGRVALNRRGKKRCDTKTMDSRKSAKEPWVLASSLQGKLMEKRVIKIYKKRMQIEEGFRDLKSSRYGFGFENTYSKKIERIRILLLIAAIASFIAWLTGWAAEKYKLHYQFQSNTIKKRRVLSLFNLGCRVIKKKIKITESMLKEAITKGLAYA